MRIIAIIVVPVFVSSLGACSSQQLYNTSQAWQRNQCERLPEASDRSRCLASNSVAYDDYKRSSEGPRQ